MATLLNGKPRRQSRSLSTIMFHQVGNADLASTPSV